MKEKNTYEIQIEEQKHTIQREEHRHLLQIMIPAFNNKKRGVAFHSRRGAITGESLTSFPEENTIMPYSRFEPEPARLQDEGHIHHTGWVANETGGKANVVFYVWVVAL
ncbi:hypothetical protein TNCV_494041 [Trichonephila clavipes]|nr:hypothetical protein TNCV_494041 [Trichonephila clavipes]